MRAAFMGTQSISFRPAFDACLRGTEEQEHAAQNRQRTDKGQTNAISGSPQPPGTSFNHARCLTIFVCRVHKRRQKMAYLLEICTQPASDEK